MLQNRKLDLLSVFLLAILPLVLYGRTAGFGFVNWDDDLYIYNNPAIRAISLDHLRAWFTRPFVSLYVPIPLFSYAFDYQVCGLNPACYHITNVLIHTVNGLLVYGIFRRFFLNHFLCFLAALLFLFHPAQVESVAWLSQRKTLLAGMFVFLSFSAYLKAKESRHGTSLSMLSLIAFVLALASKPTALGLPLIILFHSLYYGHIKARKAAVTAFVFLVPAAAAVFFTLLLYPETTALVSRETAEDSLKWFAAISAFYAGHFFMLNGSDLFYRVPDFFSPNAGLGLLQALPLVLLIIIGMIGYRRKAGYGFWLFWFFCFLLPVMNVFPIPAGDRHMYIPIAGMAGALAAILEKRPRFMSAGLLLLSVFFCIYLSSSRLGVWKDSESLWKSVQVDKTNLKVRVMTQLAGHYEDLGRLEEAEKVYWELIATKPFIPYPYINLYNIYALSGSPRTAEVEKAFTETYAPSLSLAEVYGRLLEAKADPAKVDAIIQEVIAKRFIKNQETEQS